MTLPVTFTYANEVLDFGSHYLGGDWLLTIETADDGFSFRLIDADSCGKGMSRKAFDLIQEWIKDDTAPRARSAEHTSLVRRAYQDHINERSPDDDADDRADWERDFGPAGRRLMAAE